MSTPPPDPPGSGPSDASAPDPSTPNSSTPDSGAPHAEPGPAEPTAAYGPAEEMFGEQQPTGERSAPDSPYVPVSPLLVTDPPRVDTYWLDARLHANSAGVVYTAHDEQNTPAMLVLLSQGAAGDAAARDRLAGVVNAMHIDTVLARGGQGQDFGRLGRRYRRDDDDPVAPDDRPPAPWAALAYDGSPAAAAEAVRILDEVEIANLGPQGRPSGPDYQHYWSDRVKPGLARLWPLPWPGRRDRAGWQTILVSWILMILLAALAVLIAILIFRNQPPQTPPPPTGGSGSPPPQSSSPSPQSGSPSGSPSPSDGSPSPSQSGSGSPSPSQSPSDSGSGSPSPSQSPSDSGSGSPSPSESGGDGNSESPSASAAPSSPSRL